MKTACALLLCLAAGAPVCAQTPPFTTEAADSGPKGRLALELEGAIVGDEPNFLSGRVRTSWDGPQLRLVYSPADNVEVDVEWTMGVGALDDPDFGDVSDWGDVALRTKLRFLEQGAGRPALSARIEVTLPETDADHGLGPNTLRTAVELLLSRSAGRFTVHANAGLAVQDQVQQLTAQDDFFAYGLCVLGRFATGLSLGAEVAGLAGKGSPGTEAHHEARLGGLYAHGRWSWNAALRRCLGPADGRWGFTAGLSAILR
jgi:hypothetical protein